MFATNLNVHIQLIIFKQEVNYVKLTRFSCQVKNCHTINSLKNNHSLMTSTVDKARHSKKDKYTVLKTETDRQRQEQRNKDTQ